MCIFKWLVLQNSLISSPGTISLRFYWMLLYADLDGSEFNICPFAYRGVGVVGKVSSGSHSMRGAVGSIAGRCSGQCRQHRREM